MMGSKGRFIHEQGFDASSAEPWLYNALMFQPRAVGLLLGGGGLIQSAWFFAALSALLWWSALVPEHNPFDALYNALIARRVGMTPLASGTAPRRFAAGLAGTMALAVAAALAADLRALTWAVEGTFAAAVLAVVAARFCAGAALYRGLRGRLWRASAVARQRERV